MIQPAETIKRGTHTLRSPSKVLMHMTRITAMTAVIAFSTVTRILFVIPFEQIICIVPPHLECL